VVILKDLGYEVCVLKGKLPGSADFKWVIGMNGQEGGSRPPTLFLKRYDSKRVRGRGSANDMIPWDLGGETRDL
jgi:hypothetical protein